MTVEQKITPALTWEDLDEIYRAIMEIRDWRSGQDLSNEADLPKLADIAVRIATVLPPREEPRP